MANKKWQKTKTQFLLRNTDSGRFYARLYREGREVWKSLKTDVYSVAVARLGKEVKTVKQATKSAEAVESGRTTVETLADQYLDAVRLDVGIKPSMVLYREEIVTAIFKVWPELKNLHPRSVTTAQCQEWANRHAAAYSGTRYNNALDTLRLIFNKGIEQGLIFSNPVNGIAKKAPSRKHLDLPSREEFTKVIASMRTAGGGYSIPCADLVEFLAYSGCRVDESRHIEWSDIEADAIWIKGGSTGTKSKERRRVPMIEAMRALLNDLRDTPRYRRSGRDNYVLSVRECQKSIDRACAELGIKRFTHHDLRHLFATRCIESGVDIPTVSRWIGHRDGGALAMKTYGHLRDEHSQAMAAKVIF